MNTTIKSQSEILAELSDIARSFSFIGASSTGMIHRTMTRQVASCCFGMVRIVRVSRARIAPLTQDGKIDTAALEANGHKLCQKCF